jgi:phage terminase small subunit
VKKAFAKLKAPTKKWVKRVQSTWDLNEHHDRLLVLAGQAWDRAQDAKDIVDTTGVIVKDRFNQDKQNPAVEIERQSMVVFARLLRELGLDLEKPEDSRPPYRPGGY